MIRACEFPSTSLNFLVFSEGDKAVIQACRTENEWKLGKLSGNFLAKNGKWSQCIALFIR